MDCPNTNKSGEALPAVACPPDDSLVDILARLHAKSLFRLKCVSKAWCGLISDRLRCRKFPQTLEGFFTVDDIGTRNYGGFISLSERPVPFVDPSFSFLTKLPEIEKIVLLDSCNGLVLFGHRRVSELHNSLLGYIVCNLATEQWVAVPHQERENKFDLRGGIPFTYLLFDPAASPHFQLVQLWFDEYNMTPLAEVHIFSSVTESWKAHDQEAWIQWGSNVNMPVYPTVKCSFSGMLHFIVDSMTQNQQIIAVDGEGNRSRTIQLPDSRALVAFLGQSQGRLHCICYSSGHLRTYDELSIWVLEDYDAGKWILRHSVSCSQLFGRTGCRCNVDWDVVYIHLDVGLIFIVQYLNRKLISYDMDKKQVRALCTLEHVGPLSIFHYVPYFAVSPLLDKAH